MIFSILGLNFNIGSGGKRLTEIQRQKLHLARSLLKKPDILIANQGMNTLGSRQQEDIIQTVLKWSNENGSGIIWVPMDPSFAQYFDRVLVFDSGVLVADGKPKDIVQTNDIYKTLIS